MAERKQPEPRNHTSAPEIKLPEALAEERLVLGAILSGTPFSVAADLLSVNDLSLESHRRIWLRMSEVAARSTPVDATTLANELKAHGQLESIAQGALGPLSYLTSLSAETPAIENLQAYCSIIKSRSLERQLFALNRRFAKGILSGTMDIRQALDSLGAEVQKLQDEASSGQREEGQTPEEVIANYPGGISSFLDPSLRPQGHRTCFTKLDELTGGFLGGQLIVLSGRTSSGKSMLALNIAHNFVFQDPPIPTAIFTFEMPASELLNRMISSMSGVAQFQIKNNFLDADKRRRMAEALSKITEAPLRISGRESQSVGHICAQSRRMVKKSGIKFIVIDHLGLIDSDSGGNTNRAQEINKWTRRLKLLAMELNIPVLLLCQLSRPGKDKTAKRPDLEDLKDSSGIEQDADIVMFTYRPWLFQRDDDSLKDKAELLICKHRDGELASIPLIFNGSILKFLNAE